jgi:hypothetical protein
VKLNSSGYGSSQRKEKEKVNIRLALLSPALLILALHIPKTAFIRGEGSVVPHVDEDTVFVRSRSE